MKHLSLGIATCLTTLLLAACGGGGGGNPDTGGNTPTPVSPTPGSDLLTLDDSNGGLIAVIALTNAKGAASGAMLTGALELLNAGFAIINADIQNLGYSGTEACEVGGEYSWTFTDSDDDASISSGDSWLVVNNNCETDIAFTNGSTGFSVTRLETSDTTDEYHADITYSVDLSGTLFGEASKTLGTYTWKTDTLDGVLQTNDLFINTYQSIINDEVITVTGLSYVETEDENTLSESLIMDGELSDETLGDYSIATQETLLIIDPPFLVSDRYYYQGSYTVTLEKGSVKLTALSETDVQLDVDIDGDDVPDQTINTTWGALATQYLTHLGII